MIYIFLAVLNSVIWIFISIRWKKIRSAGASPVSVFTLLCGALPLWLLTLAFLLFYFDISFSKEYFTYLIIWSALTLITNLGSIFLMKFRALSELSIYKLAFSAIIAFLIDVFILKSNFSLITPIAVTLMLASGFLVSRSRIKSDLKLGTTLLILLCLSVAGAVQFITYKSGLLLQAHPLLHSSLAQVIVYSILLIVSRKHVAKDLKQGLIARNDFLVLGLLVYAFTTIEAFLFQELPVILLISLSVLHVIMYQIYDIYSKEIKASWKIYLATSMTVFALFMIRFLK